MLTLFRSAVATVCLATLTAGQAFASSCVHPNTTDARSLLTTHHVALVRNGDPQTIEGKETCVLTAHIDTPLKGDLTAGETITVIYPDLYGCNPAAEGFLTLGQYYNISDNTFRVDPCIPIIDDQVIMAFLDQKHSLEKTTSEHPNSIPDGVRLARFYIDWRDQYRAGPALAKLLKMAPADPEVRLLEARLELLTAGWEITKLRSVREKLAALRKGDPVARVLFEEVDRAISTQSLHTLDGAPVNHVTLPPSTLTNIDLTGRDMTGSSPYGIILDGLTAPRSDWTASDLLGYDFSSADLTEAIFTEAVLARTIFKGAKLRGAKFAGALLEGADFSGAGMQLANLRGADATDAKFVEADLRGADLRGAGLQGANFTGARYDCTTRLRPDLDPQKAGMVFAGTNVCIGGEQAGK